MKSTRTWAAMAAAALTLGTLGAPALADPPETQGEPENVAEAIEKVTDATSASGVMTHLEKFEALAGEHGSRASNTPGYEAAAQYVEEQLRQAGYEPERHYYTYPAEDIVSSALTANSPDLGEFDIQQMTYSPNTPEGGITADLAVPSGSPLGCTEADWEGVDLTGQIALIQRGECAFSAKSLAAAASGAEGAVIYNNVEGMVAGTLGESNPDFIPTVGLAQADGEALAAEVANGPVNMTLDAIINEVELESFNILAETPTGNPDNVVMAGAHLDGVPGSSAINDNGSGAAATLEVALQLANAGELNNKVRFAWWGTEELGLYGSDAYVNDLVENEPAEADKIATYLNFDMVGSPNYVIGVLDADQSTYEAPVTVPEGSIETEDVFTDYFDKIDQPWVDSAFSGRSDYQAFIENDIPASGLFTGADGTKTAEEVEMFGGTEGILYDPNYHTPKDDINNINTEALDIMSKGIAHAVTSLAYDTSKVNGVVNEIDDPVRRVFGENRYGTAAEAATQLVGEGETVDRVVVASGKEYADAVAASLPRNADGSATPILLTDPERLPSETVAALEQMQPASVIVAGGTNAISSDVETAIADLGLRTERIAGDTRYDTSAEFAMQHEDPRVVYVATGADYPDALSVGALAARHNDAVLLTDDTELREETAAALETLAPEKVVVVGGEDAVSQEVIDQIGAIVPDTSRVSGADRYETAAAVSAMFPIDARAYVASGLDFADALVGGQLAASDGAPIVLTAEELPASTSAALTELSPEEVIILGGTAAVSQSVEDTLDVMITTW